MQVNFKDDERQQSVVYVKQDRKERNDRNRALHTPANLERQLDLALKVQAAYIRSQIFQDINVNSLAVKVYKPTVADKISEGVAALNKSLDGTGVRMTVKDNSITYHIDV